MNDVDYLLYGYAEGDFRDVYLDPKETLRYMTNAGFAESSLATTRKSSKVFSAYQHVGEYIERYCDFCGKPLTGVTFDRLTDGRDRCTECTESVLVGADACQGLMETVVVELSDLFGITLPRNIDLHVASQKRIAKKTGKVWKPALTYDYREVGLVRWRKWSKRLEITIENGFPRVPLKFNLARYLTVAWQMDNWDLPSLRGLYGAQYDEVRDGMSMWVAVQYLYLINERRQAERMYRSMQNLDQGSKGLDWFVRQYPLSKGIVLERDTPFQNVGEPLAIALLA